MEVQICRDDFVVCVPSGHPLATRKTLRLEDMIDERLVFLQRRVSPVFHDVIVAICKAGGIDPAGHHEVMTWSGAISLVSRGLCLAMVPGSMAKSHISNVTFVDIVGSPTRMELVLTWSRSRIGDKILETVVGALRECITASTGRPGEQ